MSKLIDNTKKTDLINDNIQPIDGVPITVDEQTVASDIASLAAPKSDESTESTTPEKIDSSHLFVVDGQECICISDTIPE